MKNILIFVISTIFLSCNNIGDKTITTEYIIDSSAIYISNLINTEIPEVEKYHNISFIKLETKEDFLISHIDKIIEKDNKYYILDKKFNQVFIFDFNGKFINQIGSIGKGPGELLSIEDISFNKDSTSVLLLSNNSMKISEYDLLGKYNKDIKIDLFASKVATDKYNNLYLFTNKNVSPISKKYDLLKTDSSGRVNNRYFPFENNEDYAVDFAGFVISGINGDILFNNSYSDTIFSLYNQKIKAKYIFNFENKNILEKENKDITNVIENYNYLQNVFIEFPTKFIVLPTISNKVTPLVISYKNIDDKKAIRFPFNWIVGSGENKYIYANISPSDILNNLEMNYIKDALNKYPELNDLLNKSNEEDNHIIVKYEI